MEGELKSSISQDTDYCVDCGSSDVLCEDLVSVGP